MWYWKGKLPEKKDYNEAAIGEWYWDEGPGRYFFVGAYGADAAELDPKTRKVSSTNQSGLFKREMKAHCEWVPYSRKGVKPKKKPITNRKWLDGLSDEEFVDWLFSHGGDKPTLWGITMVSNDSRYAVLEWLKEERK